MLKRLLLTCLFVFSAAGLVAQILDMKVLATSNEEGVPFAAVTVLPGGQSVYTDLNGRFTIAYSADTDTLFITSLGFYPFKAVIKNIMHKPHVFLAEEAVELEAVVIKDRKKKKRDRKTDPAYLLHKAIVEHKDRNDFRGQQDYQCQIYNRVQVDVNNVTNETKNMLIFRPMSFLFSDIDSTSLPKKFVPVLFAEGASNYSHSAEDERKEVVIGSKISGLDIPSLKNFTGNVYFNYNIYEDYINLFQKSFVSPLADAAWLTYNYYLTDSLKRGDTTLYKLEFVPRRKSELAFYGHLWTDNKSYAVRTIHLELLESANVNFIEGFEIDLKFNYVNGQWILMKENLFIDAQYTNYLYGFYVRKSSTFLNYQYPVDFPDGFFNEAEKSILSDSLSINGEERLQELKPLANDTTGERIYAKMDSVMNTPYVKFLKNLAQMGFSGYYPVKDKIEFGPYYSVYSFNGIEGNRFRLSAATRVKLFPKTQLYGHVAYGTKDQKFKGQGRVTHFFDLKKWHYLRADYFNDYIILGASLNAFMPDNIMSSLSRRVNPRYTHFTSYNLEYFYAFYQGVESYLRLSWEEYRPIGTLNYIQPDSSALGLIRMNTIRLGGRIAFQEKFVYYGFRRFSGSTRKPIFRYALTQGFTFNREGYNFTKAEISMTDRYYLGFLGYTNIFTSVGKVWGKLPYPMLLNQPGNDSYYFDKYAFNLMNPYEFISDEQFTLMLTHHFNGMIFNQIPLIRKWKWRSLIFGRGVIGNLSASHQEIVVLPEGLTALKEPYVEVGAGVENIFKFIRIDFLWRLTNIDADTQTWGINFAFQPRL